MCEYQMKDQQLIQTMKPTGELYNSLLYRRWIVIRTEATYWSKASLAHLHLISILTSCKLVQITRALVVLKLNVTPVWTAVSAKAQQLSAMIASSSGMWSRLSLARSLFFTFCVVILAHHSSSGQTGTWQSTFTILCNNTYRTAIINVACFSKCCYRSQNLIHRINSTLFKSDHFKSQII